MASVVALLGVLAAVAWYASAAIVAPMRVVDGFPIGVPVDCVTQSNPSCEDVIRYATEALDRREASHPAVISMAVFHEDLSLGAAANGQGPFTRSGELDVAVFSLVDGSRRAAGAYCGVGSCVGLETYPP